MFAPAALAPLQSVSSALKRRRTDKEEVEVIIVREDHEDQEDGEETEEEETQEEVSDAWKEVTSVRGGAGIGLSECNLTSVRQMREDVKDKKHTRSFVLFIDNRLVG